MMSFDKELYWKRRNEGRATSGKIGEVPVEIGGKRGQGPYPNLVVRADASTGTPFTSSKQPSKKALLKHTKRARKAAA